MSVPNPRSQALTGAALWSVLREARLLADASSATAELMPAVITGVADDSRQVTTGGVFVAVHGHAADGHLFVAAAVANGATLVIAERALNTTVPCIHVTNGRAAAALVAAAFYGRPADALRLVGVTGTNGKTTTVHMLRALLSDAGTLAASIGTLGVLVGRDGRAMPGGHGLTTPGPVEMQRVLRTLADEGVRVVAIEVSSHALDQQRVEGLRFDVGVFTSFSRDHLDYHGTMAAYLESKARLITYLKPEGVAVINATESAWDALPPAPRTLRFDCQLDAAGADARGSTAAAPPLVQRAVQSDASLASEHVRFDASGSAFDVTAREGSDAPLRAPTRLPLLGDFNVLNATGAMAAAWSLGQPLEALAAALPRMPQVPGRLERLHDRPTVLRDYAHTPDALERALLAVRPFARTPDGDATRVHVVFGCGGDRDRGKRPEMGAIAERLADVVVLTSDNPRTEDPERILDDIQAGMSERATQSPLVRIEDRRAAIAHALATAHPHDVILLAGKGHETYQVRGTERLPFDEALIVAELVS